MNIYDTAHRLAAEISRSDECVRLRELRERAYSDNTNRVLLDEYKRLQFKLQAKMASGDALPDDDMQRLTQIGTLLQLNKDVGDYLVAEFRYQRLMADVFKILSEVSGIDPEMFAR